MKKLNLEYVAHFGYDPKDIEALAIKINEIITDSEAKDVRIAKLEEGMKVILGAMIMDTIDTKTLDKLNEILTK